MSSTTSFTKAKEFTPSDVTYKPPIVNKRGGKNVQVQLNGQPLVLQIPLMLTWGLNERVDEDSGRVSYDIALQFDPHTSYFAPSAKDRFDQNISGKFEGIDARLTKRNQEVEIVDIISGGPVWIENSLRPGDKILKVSQINETPVDVVGMRLDDVIKLIKGPKGTQVILTVKKLDGSIIHLSINFSSLS